MELMLCSIAKNFSPHVSKGCFFFTMSYSLRVWFIGYKHSEMFESLCPIVGAYNKKHYYKKT